MNSGLPETLQKLYHRLESPYEPEAVAALKKLRKLLDQNGLKLDDIAGVTLNNPTAQQETDYAHGYNTTPPEHDESSFVVNYGALSEIVEAMFAKSYFLSPRELDTLKDIELRIEQNAVLDSDLTFLSLLGPRFGIN